MLVENTNIGFRYGNQLRNVNDVKEIDFNEICDYTETVAKLMTEHIVINEKGKPNFKIDDKFTVKYVASNGEERIASITEFAFTQLCAQLGLPAKYVSKCFSFGKIDLALENLQAWSNDLEKNLVFKEFDGVIRGVTTEYYKSFSNKRTLQTLKRTVDFKKYMPIQCKVAPEDLIIRFIEREPLTIKGDSSPIWNGFMVTNSEVGNGALKMTDFIYRQWCTNGMTIPIFSGTALKKVHRGQDMENSKISMFANTLRAIEESKPIKFEIINNGAEKKLNKLEYDLLVEKSKNNLKLSEKAVNELDQLVSADYGFSEWGFANSITELAQSYALEKRLEMEQYAGNLLADRAKCGGL